MLVDAGLVQLVEAPLEVLQEFVDVLLGGLHCGQAADVFTGQRLGARPEERDEHIVCVDLHVRATESYTKIWESSEHVQRFDGKRRSS